MVYINSDWKGVQFLSLVILCHIFPYAFLQLKFADFYSFFNNAACSLAIFTEDDHSTNLHGCSCHGRISSVHVTLIMLVKYRKYKIYQIQYIAFSDVLKRHSLKFGGHFCHVRLVYFLLQVCRCISELCRHRPLQNNTMLSECKSRTDIPEPEVATAFILFYFSIFCFHVLLMIESDNSVDMHIQELFARLLVLLHNPLAREQLATQILTVSTLSWLFHGEIMCYSIVHEKMVFHKQQSFTYDVYNFTTVDIKCFLLPKTFSIFCCISGLSLQSLNRNSCSHMLKLSLNFSST